MVNLYWILRIRLISFVVTTFLLIAFASGTVRIHLQGDLSERLSNQIHSSLPYWILFSHLNDADYILDIDCKSEKKGRPRKAGDFALYGSLIGSAVAGVLLGLSSDENISRTLSIALISVGGGACLFGGIGLMGDASAGPYRVEYNATLNITDIYTGCQNTKQWNWVNDDPGTEISRVLSEFLTESRNDNHIPDIDLFKYKTEVHVNTELDSFPLELQVSDDVELMRVKILSNNKVFKTYNYVVDKIAVLSIKVPLVIGQNSVKISVEDWCGKCNYKEISVFRQKIQDDDMKGSLADKIPLTRPSLNFSCTLIGNRNIWHGGKKVGFIVTIENVGEGKGEVDVILSGDEYLLRLFGTVRSLGEIEPGKTKSEVFTINLPVEPPEKEAILYVELKEKQWGESPLKKEQIKVALVKVEKKVAEASPELLYPIPDAFEGKRQNGYALIVGLSKYLNVSAPKYSKNDAETFYEYVLKIFGIQEENISILLDEKATGSVIRGKLIDWMKKKKGFKVIYFAGHGVPDPENPREGDVFLLPYDGDTESRSTLISLNEISELGANTGDTVLIFLDACFSGGEGRTVQLASRPLVVAKIYETNAITFAAAEGSQPSKEFEKAQHGYFTYYTLLGLKGKADANNDGWITTTELYDFVKEKVSDATNNVQTPVLRPEKEIRIGKVE